MGQAFARLRALRKLVESAGACSLPGCSFDFNVFVPIMQRAVIRGYVTLSAARFVADGLRNGFRCGVDVSRMRGRRVFRNYPSAFEAADKVSEAVGKRVAAAKTLCMGSFDVSRKHQIEFDVYAVFPMGAVRKKLEDAMRPVDDHTRTLLNACTCMDGLRFSLRTHEEVSALFFRFFSMSVKDVSDAFPLVPLHPSLWPFMLFQWWGVGDTPPDEWCLYVHLFAGFGMAGLPGVWKILFQDVLIGMARSEQHLSLPTTIFVDDLSIMGRDPVRVDREAASLAAFLLFLGVVMKEIKTRYASTLQLYIGLWWNSVTRTLELEESKREAYLAHFDSAADARVLSLRDVQSLAGRFQRASLTFPPGAACVFSSLYRFMRGLKLPWQKRRVPRSLADDMRWGAAMLRANLGRGWFSYDQFSFSPEVYTDASKSSSYTGGGYVEVTGQYSYFRYGSSAKRRPIDELEGDVVRLAAEHLGGPRWSGTIVKFHIDNQAFQRSGVKGWSAVDRLNNILKDVFRIAVYFRCIFLFQWIATADNFLADALSRADAPASFLYHPRLWATLRADARLTPHASAGSVRLWGKGFSSSTDGDGPRRVPLRHELTVSYSRASIYAGLPDAASAARVDTLMDNRLSASSLRSVNAALGHWDAARAPHGWPRIIPSDDLLRGGKLAAFALYLVDQTLLGFASISNYLWALRSWMKFQRQIDPAYGIVEWSDFMDALEVATFVAAEPRLEVPGEWIDQSCRLADTASFEQVQAVLLQLFLLYTFSRSESPLPSSHSGAGAFDPLKNLQVQDVRVTMVGDVRCVEVRLKAIKQDPRMERPAARGDGDWVLMGSSDVEHLDVVRWLQRYFSFFPGRRDSTAPFFVEAPTSVRALLYKRGMDNVRRLWALVPGVGRDLARTRGLHGLRVAGHNGTSRELGKDVARAQGGWASAESQGRYDRFDLAEVARIPGAIARSWSDRGLSQPPADVVVRAAAAPRAAEQPSAAVAPQAAVPPAVVPVRPGPPVERSPARLGARNVRVQQPYAGGAPSGSAGPSVVEAAPPSSACSGEARSPARPASHISSSPRVRSCRAGAPPSRVTSAPPAPPPHAAPVHRVDTADAPLSLSRPVRSSRLTAVSRLEAGVPGSWTSS